MKRTGIWAAVVLILAAVVGLPWGVNAHREKNIRNFRVVEPGVLYRSGQMSLAGFEKMVTTYGIRTVVTLRDADVEGDRPPDADEEALARKLDLRHVRIRPRAWWSESGPAPVEAGVAQFLAAMDDPAHYPVLLHCFAGIHRTGSYVAVYRMEYDRWSNARALDELRAGGYDHLDDEWDVRGFLESYRPRWMRGTAAVEGRPAAGGVD